MAAVIVVTGSRPMAFQCAQGTVRQAHWLEVVPLLSWAGGKPVVTEAVDLRRLP